MKTIKRFLSITIGLIMLISALSGMTLSSAVELEVFDPNYDFVRDGYTVIPGSEDYVKLLDSYDGRDNVIQIKENGGNVAIASKIFSDTLNVNKYNFSFDFKSDTHSISESSGSVAALIAKASSLTKLEAASDYNHWANRWSFGTDSTGFMRLFYVNGSTSLEGEDLDTKYGTKPNYQNNVWYHIDCIYDYTSTPQKIHIYCDGVEYASRELVDDEKANAFLLVSRQQNFARGDVYFSNVKVNLLGKQTITAEYDAANTTDSQIAVKFSEKINDASGLKVVDSETLETVSTGGATVNGTAVTIPVSGLKYGAEYRISVPSGLKGALDGTTTAQEICFNTADVKGAFVSHLFEDNFDKYEAAANAGSTSQDANFTSNWPIVINVGTQWGLGRYVWSNNGNNVLRIDSWQFLGAKSIKTWHKFDRTYTDGVIEYNFDLAVNDPNDTKYMTYTFGLHRGENAEPDHVFDISAGTIKLANSLGNNSSPETVTKLTMSGGLTDMVSFKVVEDLTNKKIKTYAKINDEYELLNSNPEGASISDYHYVGGTTGLDFMTLKSGDPILNNDTSMIIDNVTVDIGEPPVNAVVKKVRLGNDELTSKNASASTTDIRIYFNQDMKRDTLSNISISGAETESISYDAETYCATLKLSGMLRAKTDYVINVPTTVLTADGRALAREYAGVFTTGEGILYVSNPTLKNGDIDATKENTKAGDKLTAKVSVVNQTGSSGEYVLILAVYDGDKLIDIQYDPKTYSASDTTIESTLTYTVPKTDNEFNAQVMLWNGFDKMLPIKEAISLK